MGNQSYIHEHVRIDLPWGMLINIQFRNFCIHIKELNYIFPVHLYGCDTWSSTLMEEHKYRDFKNRV